MSEEARLPAVDAALDRASDAVQAAPGRCVRLPELAGLEQAVWVRWLYRRALERSGAWFPLVHVDLGPSELRARDLRPLLAEARSVAAGGWLYLSSAESIDAAESADCALLLGGPAGDRVSVSPETAARLRHLDHFHLVGTDPALRPLRTALLAYCRCAGTVHVSGAPGTGKTALCLWAHAQLDDEPVVHVCPGRPAPAHPGRWLLFDDLSALEDEAVAALRRAQAEREPVAPALRRTEAPIRRPPGAFGAVLGESTAICRLLHDAVRIAPRPTSVLLLGEPGAGKDLLARALHAESGRPGELVTVDLGSLPEELVASELFGHERGAFTSAERRRDGAFRQARGGTLLLDEIGNLSVRNQAVLLRVLQEKRVRPVGADHDVAVDVRVIAATNADLHARTLQGTFRRDLLDRLEAVTLRLPPLRERAGDIVLLARALTTEAIGFDPGPDWLDPAAVLLLEAHAWPGNVRELAGIAANIAARVTAFPVRPADLGPLAPERRRAVPLLTTSLDPRDPLPGDRSLAARLSAVQLQLPPLRERGASSIRNAVLGALGGRLVTREALRLLESHAWWGNFTELHTALDALRSSTGDVDGPAMGELLPHLLRRQAWAPICALLSPRVLPDGSTAGLRTDFDHAAVLIGRVRSLAELERAYRGQERLGALRALLGGLPGFLDLPWAGGLSRAHVVVARGADGLEVHKVPGVGATVLAGALRDSDRSSPSRAADSRLRPVDAGAPVPVGEAGEVRLVDPRGGPDLPIYVFAGAVALDQYGPVAVGRGSEPSLPPTREEPEEDRAMVWQLDEDESAVLTDLVVSFEGGSFKAHLEQVLVPRRDQPPYARLARYLLGPRPTQYCARLYEHPTNQLLRTALATALARVADPADRVGRLPMGIRRCLEPEV